VQLGEKLSDLVDQIRHHIQMTDSFKRTLAPNGHHIVAEYAVRQTFDVMLARQLQGLHDIADLASNICEQGARP
jgi:hypothetical protein